ncbi:AAA family ATPase [Flavobacterium sp. SUN052]|uniref:AAA family ATPase n=1 Tax=Flavobacterium sp. SUN052 TaxID=3002441 RepID=UPI00237D8647|nr:AAA family ATPase [Flavobacterium sp. SUN052]MEC4004832.1 AAA family ATPase [Flavobacterium sp. SUN052]
MKKEILERPAVYFSTLEIENVKSFGEKQILDLKNRDGSISPWTLILGDNGVGKTTLLHCLALMIPVEAPMLKTEISVLNGETEKKKQVIVSVKPYMDDLDEANFDFEKLIRIAEDINTKISATLTNGVELKERQTEGSGISIAMEFEKIKGKLEVITPSYDKLDVFESPKIFAYGANRHVAYKNIDNSELKDPIYNLFSGSGDLYDAEQVLSMLDTASIRLGGKGKAADLLFKIKEILVDLLPDIKDIDSIIINSPINEDGSINENIVEVQTEDGRVKLFNLSLGYLTMLTWIVDLAVHMLWAFPESKEPLKEPAIVLVDEIDLHLHPVWQRMIMKKLTDHFPRAQFICTAHSPIMAQASENQNLAVVKRVNDGEVSIENLPHIVKGWRIGQLLTSELFDFESDRGPEVDEILDERRKLLEKEKLEPLEQTRLDELNKEIDNIPFGNSEEQDDAMKLLEEFSKKLDIIKAKEDDKNS